MQHVKPMTRVPAPAQQGVTTPLESIILLLITVVFQDWDNFPTVIQNLQKFYSKTPA